MTNNIFDNISDDFNPTDLSFEDELTGLANKPIRNAKLIPITEIAPDPDQPRTNFNTQTIIELADSIKARGLIEPLTVRFDGLIKKYLIVTGERRFRAAQQAGLTHLPCLIRDLADDEALILQIIENVQREDFKPIEEAKAYKRLMDMGWPQTKISEETGKSQPYISRIIQILTLPPGILEEAAKANVSKEHLFQLTRTREPEAAWLEIKEQGKTAKEIKTEVEKENNPKGRPKNYRYHYNPKGKMYRVTVEIKKTHAENQEIRTALNEALNNLPPTTSTSHN